MPSIETSDLHQTAVLWPTNGVDDYGNPAVGSPVQLSVRWESGKRDTLDEQGNTIAVDATVVVDRIVTVGSEMWLGSLASIPGTGSDPPDDNLMVVVGYNETPDIKNRNTRRVVLLKRK